MGRGMQTVLALLTGGLIGAVTRPAVFYAFWLRNADRDALPTLLALSAGIGLVVGILAVVASAWVRGMWASAGVAAACGAGLAFLAAVATFLPLFWGGLLGFGSVRPVDDEAPLYGIAMALTGALSGGGGAILRSWRTEKRPILAHRV